MKKIDVIIVDDDINNVDLLEYFLKKYCPLANIVGKAYSKNEAIKVIDSLKPQLIFLDIVLGDGDGFEVLEEINHEHYKVVFVTGFNQFAVKAFKYNALDYLIKPVEIESLIASFNNALQDIEKDLFISSKQINNLSGALSNKRPLDLIAISSLDKIEIVKLADIIFLKSDGKYTEIYIEGRKKIVASKNLGEYDQIIDNINFFRIHNSYIVNIKRIKNIIKTDGVYCIMQDGSPIPIAKRRRNELNRLLKI